MSALHGRRVLVTRPRDRATRLVELLESRGAICLLVPAIQTVPPLDPAPLAEAVSNLDRYDWIVFTSAAAVDAVFDVVDSAGAPVPRDVAIAVVGPSTAAAVRARGARVDVMPEEFRGAAVAGAIGELSGKRVLLPRSDIARPQTADALRARGAQVDDVIAYRTVPAGPEEETDLPRAGGEAMREPGEADDSPGSSAAAIERVVSQADAITFASPSGVRGLARMTGGTFSHLAERAIIACIGPATSAAARELGLAVHVEPEEHTAVALVDALESYWALSSIETMRRSGRDNPLTEGA